MTELPTIAVIMAAGKGTRMRSDRAKVLHKAAGRSLLAWVLEAARGAGSRRHLVVVGHQAEEVKRSIRGDDIEWVEQTEQRGTGHALQLAVEALKEPARLLILSGDVPLVTAGTLRSLLDSAAGGWSMAVAELDLPGSLGRVVPKATSARSAPGGANSKLCLEKIVEASDASPSELAIRTINAGIYTAPSEEIAPYLASLDAANAQGELYLTDAFTEAVAQRVPVELFELEDEREALGVNDRADLARVHKSLLRRRCDELMREGVTILEPERTVIEAEVEVGPDSVIHPGASLLGRTKIGRGSTLEASCWIRDSTLGERVIVGPMTVVDRAIVDDECKVGPFARLRPGAILGEGSKVGNFVEIKNARLAAGVKAGHLTYLGDADVAAGANIGAGTVTCNYDGEEKHRTEIGEGAFIGSDTMLVAPVRVGERATTAAGSVITSDVPDGALGVGRARQRTIEGWAERRKRNKEKRSE